MTPLQTDRILRLIAPVAKAVAIAFVGGAIFAALGLPAPWLSGGTITVALASLGGVRMSLPDRARDAVFILLGLSMGSGVTPETLHRLGDWPLSLVVLVATILAVIAASQIYFIRYAGMDRLTAFFASIPGAMSNVLAMAITTGADVPRITVSQTMRVVLLVAVLPLVISTSGFNLQTPAPLTLTLRGFALELVFGTACALMLQWLRVPGGLLNGAFFVSAILHGTGTISGNLPMPALNTCLLVIGIVIGNRFQGTELSVLRRSVGEALAAFALAVAVSLVGVGLVVALSGSISFGAALLAFAPGGLEAMMALSFALGLDPAYVAVHHLVRFVLMAVGMPLMLVIAVPAGERQHRRQTEDA